MVSQGKFCCIFVPVSVGTLLGDKLDKLGTLPGESFLWLLRNGEGLAGFQSNKHDCFIQPAIDTVVKGKKRRAEEIAQSDRAQNLHT